MGGRALSPPAEARSARARLAAYCLYDFGNSAFTTIIVTVVYSVYFRAHVAGGGPAADLWWGLAVSSAMALVALGAPVLGARADRFGTRHRYLVGATLVSVAATAGLGCVGGGAVVAGVALFVLAQAGYAVGEAFYNAFLPDVARPERIGTVSGLAWGIGYLGGLLSLAVAARVLPATAGPGPGTEPAYQRLFLLVAAQYLIFTAPALALLRDRRGASPAGEGTLRRLGRTAREVGRFRHVALFLAAYFIYDNGLSVVIAFTSIYMVTTLGFSMADNLRLFVLLQITAALGAWAAGWWADRRGARNAVLASLVLWVGVLGAMAAATSREAFTVLALAGGLGIGSTQACSRALLAHIVPPAKRAEFFGFFAFCTKASGSVGPALFGALSAWTGNQRLALVCVLSFFIAGLILLALVDERAARRAAAEYVEPALPSEP